MKLNRGNKVRVLSGMIAASFAIMMALSAATPALAQGANAPVLNVGDSAYFGDVVDMNDYKDEMNEALAEYENMGFDVDFDVSGGAGAYFGWEVVSDTADINGNTCYDIALMGGVGIDFSLDAKVKGSFSDYGASMSVDAKVNAVVKGEAVLDGNLYLTVDELAVAKLQLRLTAEAEADIKVDATMDYGGESMDMKADATIEVKGVEFNVVVQFDPPIDIYDFPINQGDMWYVPAQDTAATGTASATGTISYDVTASGMGENYDDSDTINLANEIGSETISETIPGGPSGWNPDTYEYSSGGIEFTCTRVVGNIATIEVDMFGMLDSFDIPLPGTRQFDIGDYTDMVPSAGMQVDTTKGMMTGVEMGGETMTEPVTKAEVEDFVNDPQGKVTAETGGGSASGGGGFILILLIVVVLVVVLVVVMMMSKKKKSAPQPYQGPEQQMYGQQPGYEQPPTEYAPPPEQPPQGQYPPPPQNY